MVIFLDQTIPRMRLTKLFLLVGLSLVLHQGHAQAINVDQKLKGIDAILNKILKDWNVPGLGVGIVVKDKLVFAKGYGFRNLEKKLPVTPNTLFQIASNSKLFTATAVGFLVDEGTLEWDKPIKTYVPQIQFYNDELTANVTIRDMLSHRTGISRHDNIWYKSDFTKIQLFERLKYLEPSLPLRQGFLYNNLMYSASGQVVEFLSGQTWEDFVTARIFKPLNMSHSMFVVEDMQKTDDFMSPYYEKRDTTTLLPYPFYTKQQGLGPAGGIISSINDLSAWLIAQMHGGKFNGKQVIPTAVVKETMQPASITSAVPDKYFESLNSMYGMGRGTSSYKGHYRTQHTGAIGGIYSHISFLPADSVGIITFVNGNPSYIPTIVANILYDKLLGLEETPWSDRALKDYLKNKATDREARKKPDVDRVPNTKPSHALSEYVGKYEDPAYGIMEIQEQGGQLRFMFNNTSLPLSHYHYERFVSPDDEIDGKWSLLFDTDAQGSVDKVRVSLDEKEVIFVKKASDQLFDVAFLKKLTGTYELNGANWVIALNNKELVLNTAPPQHLEPRKGTSFRIREFTDQTIEFVLDKSGNSTGCKLIADGKSVLFTKKK
jgi:CubicO group peptidase (beta-lactamase class C family)